MESDLERLRERIRELEIANEALRQSEQMLATELEIGQLLQHVAVQSINSYGSGPLYQQILNAARAILHSDFASIQMFYPERGSSGELRLLGHRGFSEEAAKRWEWVNPSTRTTCGEALRTGRRVAVPDLGNCDFMAGSDDLEAFREVGIQAAQSLPLVSRAGTLLGMVTTYWREPHELSVSEQRALDILARLAADLIEGSRAVEKLGESEKRFRATFFQAAVGIAHTGLDGHWLLLNDCFCEFLGYPPAELRHKSFLDTTHPEDREDSLAAMRRLLSGEISSWSKEKRYIRKDGVTVWGRLFTSLVRDQHDQPQYFVSIVEDITEKVQTERALRDAEQRLTMAQDAAYLGVWDRDVRIEVITICGKFAQLHGLPPERTTITREEWFSLIHPDDRERLQRLRQEARELTHTFDAEFRVIWPEGSVHWLRAKGTVLVDDSGRPIRTMGVIEDITRRKQAEAALRESESRLLEAQNLAKIGSWTLEVEAGTLRWSDETFCIFGLTKDAPLNLEGVLDYVHPKDRQRFLEADSKIRSSTAPVEVEYRIVWPNGETRFLRSIATAIRNYEGALIRITGAVQDITEHVRANDLLRESEARLKSAERLAHVGNWQWDLKSNKVSWSEEMFRIFGQPLDYIPSYEQFLKAIAPHDRKQIERMSRELAGQVGYSREYQIVLPTGELRTVSSTFEVFLNEDGSPERVFGACQDITDLRRAQEESFARQKLESVGTLAGGIAHDFNNLLGGVLAQADLALAECDSGSSPKEEINGIRNVAIRGSEIVRQLMIYAGKESETLELVDVSRVVSEMIELLKVSVSKHARLETDLGPDVPAVRGNVAQIRQIVMNLVTNASEAIGEQNGVIRIATRRLKVGPESSRPTSQDLAQGDYLQLEVSDTGCGMSPETQARIFDPFFTTKSSGHGLGLAVVDGVVRRLRGSIQLTSEAGKGTTFQVLVPCVIDTAAGASDCLGSNIRESVRPLQQITVLVVEDEDLLRQAVAKMLRKTGFFVLEAGDGSAAIDLLRAHRDKVDLMLLDVTIPGASSQEVLAEAVQARSDVRVILTSAYSQEMLKPAMSASQIRGFIRKPFQLSDLVQQLRSAAATGSGMR